MIVGENLLKKGFGGSKLARPRWGSILLVGLHPFHTCLGSAWANRARSRGSDRPRATKYSLCSRTGRDVTSHSFRMPSTIIPGSKMLTGHIPNHPRDGQDADNGTRTRVALITASRRFVTEASYRTNFDPVFRLRRRSQGDLTGILDRVWSDYCMVGDVGRWVEKVWVTGAGGR